MSQQIAEILEKSLSKKLQWLNQNRIFFYKPQPEQAQFHNSPAHVRIACGANRSGKTTAGVVEDICFALGFYPWKVDKNLLNAFGVKALMTTEFWRIPQEARTPLKPPVKVLILEDDWDTADEILVAGSEDRAGKLTYYIPQEALNGSPIKNALGYLCSYEFCNGSTIRIDTEKSFVNDPNSFEGGTSDLLHYDEGKKRELRIALKRGLVDKYGYEIFTLTPLCEPWIYHEIYKKCGVDPNYSAFKFDTETNPYISKEGWEAFKATLTEDEMAARARGEWVFLKGLVYPEFVCKSVKDGGHLAEPLTAAEVSSLGTVYIAIDPHARQPLTALFLVADFKGRLVLWDEVYKKCLIDEFCDLIKSKLMYTALDKKGHKVTKSLEVARYLIDPIAYIPDPVTDLTWADEFALMGLPVEPAHKNKAQGILETRQAFKDGHLLVCKNCLETVREIQLYVYQEWKYGDRSEKEKPVDKDDHMMECMYRLVVCHPEYIKPEDYSKPIETVDLAPFEGVR